MRTTLTIDDDLAMLLRRRARELQRPFKDIVNEALRRGLAETPVVEPVEVPRPRAMGRPQVDVTQGLRLVDELDDARDRP